MSNKYLLYTGESDYKRLSILSRLYNPLALSFLQDSGIQPGMTVLEVGCGTGHMACDLATLVGPQGRVIAIDSSADQIKVSQKTAKTLGITNIDFYVADVFQLDKLNVNYDATYGRWVIEFSKEPAVALALMFEFLNPGGILCYEATNFKQTAYFSYPFFPCLDTWFNIAPKMFSFHGYSLKFGHEAPFLFKNLGCKHIKAKINQAILLTEEDKSVYRLGLYSVKGTLLSKGLMTEQEFEMLHDECFSFEKSDAISGFFSNILVSGIK